jgi:hypothetical protein
VGDAAGAVELGVAAIGAPTLMPVTTSKDGRSPRSLQPVSRPAPYAPSAAPPESASMSTSSPARGRPAARPGADAVHLDGWRLADVRRRTGAERARGHGSLPFAGREPHPRATPRFVEGLETRPLSESG